MSNRFEDGSNHVKIITKIRDQQMVLFPVGTT
jgi:hypothetical protein